MVVGLDPNFFVTEARVRCLNGTLSGRTLYCSLPLARILSRAEFDAVIGHELGHFRGQDTQFSQRFYPIYRGTADSLRALGNIGVGGAGLLPLLPAVGVMLRVCSNSTFISCASPDQTDEMSVARSKSAKYFLFVSSGWFDCFEPIE